MSVTKLTREGHEGDLWGAGNTLFLHLVEVTWVLAL